MTNRTCDLPGCGASIAAGEGLQYQETLIVRDLKDGDADGMNKFFDVCSLDHAQQIAERNRDDFFARFTPEGKKARGAAPPATSTTTAGGTT